MVALIYNDLPTVFAADYNGRVTETAGLQPVAPCGGGGSDTAQPPAESNGDGGSDIAQPLASWGSEGAVDFQQWRAAHGAAITASETQTGAGPGRAGGQGRRRPA